MPTSFENLIANTPRELRKWRNFVCWRYEDRGGKKPTKPLINPHTGYLARVDNPATWGSFEEALNAYQNDANLAGIGFVLTSETDFALIDIDSDCDKETAQQLYEKLDSYTELSPSRNGVHIIVNGKIPGGAHRKGIGLFSDARYFTITGEVIKNGGIKNRQAELTEIYNDLVPPTELKVAADLTVRTLTFTDQEIIKQANAASNAEKFVKLWNGDWRSNYPSQSEADQALLDIIAFYTQDREQIERVFRLSALALTLSRKGNPANYIKRSINLSLDRAVPLVDIKGFREAAIQIAAKEEIINEPAPPSIPYWLTHNPGGLFGDLVDVFFNMAPRPLMEAAIAASIGLMAGIAGRCYNVSKTGLNQYVLFVGQTGVGKEIIHQGPSTLTAHMQRAGLTQDISFIGPSKIASGQALLRDLEKHPNGYVSILGEFGMRLQRMSSTNANGAEIFLQELLLDVYNKSGRDQGMPRSVYAEKDKNISFLKSPCLSLLAESAPTTLYNTMTETMIGSGLLPRFLLIEYLGKRPNLNKAHEFYTPAPWFIKKFAHFIQFCWRQNSIVQPPINIEIEPRAAQMLDDLDQFSGAQIDDSSDEIIRQIWNRAHIKAWKMAGLLAVGREEPRPLITQSDVDWSISLIHDSSSKLLNKFEAGEIGSPSSENKQLLAILNMCRQWIRRNWDELKSYNVGNEKMHLDKIIPHSFLVKRLNVSQTFKGDRVGPTVAIKRAIMTLVDTDKIRVVPPEQRGAYNTREVCYMMSDVREM